MEKDFTKEFTRIYNNEAAFINAYLIALAGSVIADDILQETFLRFYKSCQMKGFPEKPKAYLFKIARNTFFNVYKKNKNNNSNFNIQDLSSGQKAIDNDKIKAEKSDDGLLRIFLTEAIENAIISLPEKEKEVMNLRWNFYLSVKECSLIINKSVRQTRRILKRAGEIMKNKLEKEGWELEDYL